MSPTFKKILVIAFASAGALALFRFGLSYPLAIRVRGDAYGYLKIAESFDGFASAWSYSGDRTAGFPFFEYVMHQMLSIFSPTVFLLTWINAIGLTMLMVHITAAWLFAAWARCAKIIESETANNLLFIYLATCPVLIGHTTSPLTDTFSIDLILLALVLFASALRARQIHICLTFSVLAAVFFGFSVLVRPASLIALGLALLLCWHLSLRIPWSGRLAIGATLIGCLIVLAPSFFSCTQKYEIACLQSPKTFNAIASAQDGLRGARVMWSQQNDFPGTLPMVADDTMFNNYYRQCQIQSIVGSSDNSLTGCLLARPLTLPTFVVKKWIGLFDYFRFTPYTENLTPAWLRNSSRAYGALVWLGLSLCFVTLMKLREVEVRSNLRKLLAANTAVVFLVSYSVVMLAQHTVLHTEERYGFPLIPLCAAVFFGYCERAMSRYRSGERRGFLPSLLFCCLVLGPFVAQIIAWDHASFAAMS
jgi:hypothetical protein